MTDTMTVFARINAPRIKKIEAMISVIFKSARSNKIDGDTLNALLWPLAERLGFSQACPKAPIEEPEPHSPAAPAERVWHPYDICLNVAAIPDNQITAYATQIVSRLCETVEVSK